MWYVALPLLRREMRVCHCCRRGQLTGGKKKRLSATAFSRLRGWWKIALRRWHRDSTALCGSHASSAGPLAHGGEMAIGRDENKKEKKRSRIARATAFAVGLH